MNISVANYEALFEEFSADVAGDRTQQSLSKKTVNPRFDRQRRHRKSPQQFNGIHRRRAKKIRW